MSNLTVFSLKQIDGKGVMRAYGSMYEGDFVEDKKCGFGRMIFSTEEVYEGEWKDDVPSILHHSFLAF